MGLHRGDTECEADAWWIIGDIGGNCYVRWKDDGVSGRYVQTRDAEEAERFDTKEETLLEIASSYVQNDLDWDGEPVPFRVEKTVRVRADP